MKATLILLLSFILALLCPGCYGDAGSFYTKPIRTADGAIGFIFLESSMSKKPLELQVTEFGLQKRLADKKWVIVWHVVGVARLTDLEYGSQRRGLEIRILPQPLEINVKYRAFVTARSWFGGIEYSGIYFLIDAAGSIKVGIRD